MKILIIGGGGFIGKHLAHSLISDNHQVVIVDSKYIDFDIRSLFAKSATIVNKKAQDFLSELLTVSQIPLMEDLIEDPTPFDVIFDLSVKYKGHNSINNPEECLTNNIGIVLYSLAYCRQYPKTKYIFASSGSVKNKDLSKNPYAFSKSVGEQSIEFYRNSYLVDATSVRLFNVYGPGEIESGICSPLIAELKRAVWDNLPFTIKRNTLQRGTFTHVFDVVSALISIMREEKFNPLYEIGTSSSVFRVDEILKAFGIKTNSTVSENSITNLIQYEDDDTINCASPNLAPKFWYPKHDLISYILQWKINGRAIT